MDGAHYVWNYIGIISTLGSRSYKGVIGTPHSIRINSIIQRQLSPVAKNPGSHHMAPTKDIREKFGRFRILVVGRANAGKTTLLQRVCNTTEKPEIFDRKGNKVNPHFCGTSDPLTTQSRSDRC